MTIPESSLHLLNQNPELWDPVSSIFSDPPPPGDFEYLKVRITALGHGPLSSEIVHDKTGGRVGLHQ